MKLTTKLQIKTQFNSIINILSPSSINAINLHCQQHLNSLIPTVITYLTNFLITVMHLHQQIITVNIFKPTYNLGTIIHYVFHQFLIQFTHHSFVHRHQHEVQTYLKLPEKQSNWQWQSCSVFCSNPLPFINFLKNGL